MTNPSLLSGEPLRMENGPGYVRRLARRLAQALRDRAQARRLARLDARTLRDIGLGADSSHPLAGQIDAYRRQYRLRAFAAGHGL